MALTATLPQKQVSAFSLFLGTIGYQGGAVIDWSKLNTQNTNELVDSICNFFTIVISPMGKEDRKTFLNGEWDFGKTPDEALPLGALLKQFASDNKGQADVFERIKAISSTPEFNRYSERYYNGQLVNYTNLFNLVISELNALKEECLNHPEIDHSSAKTGLKDTLNGLMTQVNSSDDHVPLHKATQSGLNLNCALHTYTFGTLIAIILEDEKDYLIPSETMEKFWQAVKQNPNIDHGSKYYIFFNKDKAPTYSEFRNFLREICTSQKELELAVLSYANAFRKYWKDLQATQSRLQKLKADVETISKKPTPHSSQDTRDLDTKQKSIRDIENDSEPGSTFDYTNLDPVSQDFGIRAVTVGSETNKVTQDCYGLILQQNHLTPPVIYGLPAAEHLSYGAGHWDALVPTFRIKQLDTFFAECQTKAASKPASPPLTKPTTPPVLAPVTPVIAHDSGSIPATASVSPASGGTSVIGPVAVVGSNPTPPVSPKSPTVVAAVPTSAVLKHPAPPLIASSTANPNPVVAPTTAVPTTPSVPPAPSSAPKSTATIVADLEASKKLLEELTKTIQEILPKQPPGVSQKWLEAILEVKRDPEPEKNMTAGKIEVIEETKMSTEDYNNYLKNNKDKAGNINPKLKIEKIDIVGDSKNVLVTTTHTMTESEYRIYQKNLDAAVKEQTEELTKSPILSH